MGLIEHWSAVAATLVDLAKRDLPPHISEAEQVEAYLGLKRIAADYRGAVEALGKLERDGRRALAQWQDPHGEDFYHQHAFEMALNEARATIGGQ